MKRIRLLLAGFLLLGVSLFALPAFSNHASALFDAAKDQALCGINTLANDSDTATNCSTAPDQSDKVNSTIRVVLNILSMIAGIVAVIMLLIGGIRFVTSQGEGGSTAAARNTVLYALVGLVVVALAQAIVLLVVNRSINGAPVNSGSSTTAPAPTVLDTSNKCAVTTAASINCKK